MIAAIQAFPLIGRMRATKAAAPRGCLRARLDGGCEIMRELVEQYGIAAEDALVLAFISKAKTADISLISREMRLKRRQVIDSVCRLIRRGLADADITDPIGSGGYQISPTHTGRLLAMRVLPHKPLS